MTAINNAVLNTDFSHSNGVAVTEQTSDGSNKKNISSENKSGADSVAISSRAQNIQKLNEEFFAQGFASFSITTDFVTRLEEYGLVTAEEASELISRVGGSENEVESANSPTINEFIDFINDYSASLENDDPQHSLIDILQQAKEALENLSGNSKTINISSVTGQLQSYIDTHSDEIKDTDKKTFEQIVSALELADILTPSKNVTKQVENYLSITKF